MPNLSASGPLTGQVTSNGSTSTTETGETGETGSADECDPLDDPVSACGQDMRCDVETLTCVPAPGTGIVDDACADDDECAAPWVCVDGRCRELCSTTQTECGDERVCTVAAAPLPGLCLAPCVLLSVDCTVPGDACKPATDIDGQTIAVCSANPGSGVEDSTCTRDADCAPDFVCTPTAEHSVPCLDAAPACCAPMCDQIELPCLDLEICNLFGIADQPNAGYCGSS